MHHQHTRKLENYKVRKLYTCTKDTTYMEYYTSERCLEHIIDKTFLQLNDRIPQMQGTYPLLLLALKSLLVCCPPSWNVESSLLGQRSYRSIHLGRK